MLAGAGGRLFQEAVRIEIACLNASCHFGIDRLALFVSPDEITKPLGECLNIGHGSLLLLGLVLLGEGIGLLLGVLLGVHCVLLCWLVLAWKGEGLEARRAGEDDEGADEEGEESGEGEGGFDRGTHG
jgi:hypothetical protein